MNPLSFLRILFFRRFSRGVRSSRRETANLGTGGGHIPGALVAARLWETASSGSCSFGSSVGTGSHCLADSRDPWLAKQAPCSQWNWRQLQTAPLCPTPDSNSCFTSLTVWIQICQVNASISSALPSSPLPHKPKPFKTPSCGNEHSVEYLEFRKEIHKT